MKKVGIITFHNALSFGAGFQAYALQEYLCQKGLDAEIIDYVPKRFQRSNILHIPNASNIVKRCIKFLPYVTCQTTSYTIMQRFCRNHLKLSSHHFEAPEELHAYPFSYSAFITGSDQVWNLKFDNFSNIRPYLLDFVPAGSRKISYASSIGMEDLSSVPVPIRNEFLSLLRKYDSVAVRECTAADLLNGCGVSASWVLDPTFLLTASQWGAIAEKPRKMKDGPFVFVYGLYRNKALYRLAHKIAQAHGWNIVNMADGYDFCKHAHNDIVVTHEDLLWYLKNAACVLTDSFHGCALSLNFGRPLFIFKAARYNTRLESLIRLFRLENRVVQDPEEIDADHIDMDYTFIRDCLQHEREKAANYLNTALE